jgi:hypothetical protein
VTENVGAIAYGQLGEAEMQQIDDILNNLQE